MDDFSRLSRQVTCLNEGGCPGHQRVRHEGVQLQGGGVQLARLRVVVIHEALVTLTQKVYTLTLAVRSKILNPVGSSVLNV